MVNGEIVFKTGLFEKIVLFEVKGLTQIIVTFGNEKGFCMFLVRVTKYRARKQLCSNTLKRSKLNIFVSLKEKGGICCKQLWLISEIRFGS